MLLILFFLGYFSLNLIIKIIETVTKSKINWCFKIEDIIVTSLAILSLILIAFKYFNLPPTLHLISLAALCCLVSIFIALPIYLIIFSHKYLFKNTYLFSLQKPVLSNCFLFSTIFLLYLVRALFKAKDFQEIVYIPSRYNTDIFLYLRRISVFLGEQTYSNHQYNNVSVQNILYDSPKLLSSFIYAAFTNRFQSLSIAGTVLTSLILTAIIFKYILLLSKNNFAKPFYIAILIFLFFFPAFSWLQDQFYLSNLLYLYLLIYGLSDFFLSDSFNHKTILKYGISLVAVAGFYPSQIPFFALAATLLLVLVEGKLSIRHILKICLLTIITILIFLPQYTATSEVVQHFNLIDAKHGVNFSYIPFWSILNVVPKPGGFKVDFSSVALVIFSILLTVFVIKYLAKNNIQIAKYLYIGGFLYIVYSLSFIAIPGSYRQGKFLITYIIPLLLFCAIRIITSIKIHNKIATAVMIILAIYVSWNSLDRKYKSHINRETQQTINYIIKQNKPVAFYYKNLDHRYYYFSYQLRNYPLKMVDRCPSDEEIKAILPSSQTIVIAQACSFDNSNFSDNTVVKLDF